MPFNMRNPPFLYCAKMGWNKDLRSLESANHISDLQNSKTEFFEPPISLIAAYNKENAHINARLPKQNAHSFCSLTSLC